VFAFNEIYFMTDKKVMERIGRMEIVPPRYVEEVMKILASPGDTPSELVEGVSSIERVWQGVVELASEGYRPKYYPPPTPPMSQVYTRSRKPE
jgi:hypothetical protein